MDSEFVPLGGLREPSPRAHSSESTERIADGKQDSSSSKSFWMWALTDYSVLRFERSASGVDEDGQPIWPSWEKAIVTQVHISRHDAHAQIQQLNRSTKPVGRKKITLTPALGGQVDMALDRLSKGDSDIVNFHWTLAQLDHDLRTIQWHSSSKSKIFRKKVSTRKAYERIWLTAYFKRSPRAGVDITRLWEATKLKQNHSAEVDLRLDVLSPPQAFSAQDRGEGQHKTRLEPITKGTGTPDVDSDEFIENYYGVQQKDINQEDESTSQLPTLVQQSRKEHIRFETSGHVRKARAITTEKQISLPNSEFDSGYRSMSLTKEELNLVDEIGRPVDHEFIYSEAGSLDGRTENYAQYFGEEVILKLKDELKDLNWTYFRTALSDLLREFAIRVGDEGGTQYHRDLMYWTHKWHDDIVRCIEKKRLLRDLDYEDGPQKQDGDPDWRDRIDLLFDRDDEHYSEGVAPATEGKALAPIEIEPYQQIVSQSPAFEWLVSAIRNSAALDIVGDNIMNGVRQDILTELDRIDQNRGYSKARISRHKNPTIYCVNYTLRWPSAKIYQEEDSLKAQSDIFERVLTFTGDPTRAQALPCEDYINQTWPTTGPLLIQSILEALNRDVRTKRKCEPLRTRDLFRIQISGEIMQVYSQGNAFELAEIGTQLAWLASALYPESKFKQGIICKPRVRCCRSDLERDSKQREAFEDLSCQFEFETTTFNLDNNSGTNGDCWQGIMNNFVLVTGFPIRSRLGGNPGLEIPLDIAADFVGTRKVTRFKGRPLIKGFSTMLCPISCEDGVIYWHVLKYESGRISFTDARIDSMSTIEPGSLTLSDLESARHIVGWCTEVERFAGTIDANLDIRRTYLKQPPKEWALKEIQVGGGQYINVLATFAVRENQKALKIERDRLDYYGNMEWIAKRHVILHDTEASERRAWLIDGASALLHLVFASLWKNQHGVLRHSYIFDMQHLKLLSGNRTAGMATSLSVLTDFRFLGTRLRAKDPLNLSDWYLLKDRVNEIFDLLAQMIDHQEDIHSGNGLGKLVSFSPWKQHVGWAFADIASPGEPCNLKAIDLKNHGEGWAYFVREIHAVTLFGSGFGDLLRPATVTPDPCSRCLWESLAPKGGDILAVSLEDLELHLESSSQRHIEVRHILGQRLSKDSCDSSFRACSRGNCVTQRIQTFHKTSGKGYGFSWQTTSSLKLDEVRDSIYGATLLGVRPRVARKWIDIMNNDDQQQQEEQRQLHSDPNELGVDDGVSNITTPNSAPSQESEPVTSALAPSTPGSSVPPGQPDSPAILDENIKIPSQLVHKDRNPIRRIRESTNSWIRKLKSP